jgi:hypothetical protein
MNVLRCMLWLIDVIHDMGLNYSQNLNPTLKAFLDKGPGTKSLGTNSNYFEP